MAVPDSSEPPKPQVFTSRHYENLVRLMVRLSEQYIQAQRKREYTAAEEDETMAEWTGDDTYFLRGRLAEDNSCTASSRPSKRLRRSERQNGSSSLDLVPDEILTAIFGCIPSARDRSNCASVCKRWLMLLTHMRRDDFRGERSCRFDESDGSVNQPPKAEDYCREDEDFKLEKQPLWALGDLTRCLEGKKATDVRLASIAVGTGAHGGLGKLIIRGDSVDRSAKCVTDVGLMAIGTCCNALRSLTLSDCPNIGDESLKSIGSGCRLLESLDLLKCPNVGDTGLQAIAAGCLRLSSLTIDSCEGVKDAGLRAVAENCSNLLVVTLSRCSNLGNTSVVAFVQHSKALRKLKLEKIGVSDSGLAYLSHHCKSLTKLVLSGLDKVTQKGFNSLSHQFGLKSLRILVLNGCIGVTDHFLLGFGKACKELKGLCLIDCERVSDVGLEAIVDGCRSLKGLHIERCNQITYDGIQTCVGSVSTSLKTLHISKCSRAKDTSLRLEQGVGNTICTSVTSLSLTYCDGVGDRYLGFVGLSFASLEHLDLSGMAQLSDEGLSAFLDSSGERLVSLNLKDCCQITDEAVLAVAAKCRGLQLLALEGCSKVTDRSILVVMSKCSGIQELDVSRCGVTDNGVLTIAISIGPSLKTLSVSGCQGITDKSLPVIQRMCDSLAALNVKNCRGLSRDAVEKLEAELGKRCHIVKP